MSMMREKCRLRHDDETKANKHRTEKMIAKTFPLGILRVGVVWYSQGHRDVKVDVLGVFVVRRRSQRRDFRVKP